ncbi:putative aromatic acid decarboxylase [Posidoniimonas polymericola]|uniref:Flavin prenyltransferase UbiX n=1 Tax=Posidoniimonas polymericola TaxID=2528002 RepID=A0A5C5ZE38_9BACT|nr:flavin prenyltransferase UbiX [Posidoniimonas polymericola]TWT85614.1 putative aromatic acid decarboxylase [Posidoniimonas polymericola]
MTDQLPIILGVTGASGAVYTVRLLEVLLAVGRDVHLAVSPSGAAVVKQELGFDLDLNKLTAADLSPERTPLLADRAEIADPADKPGVLHYHHYQDFMAPIASGSFLSGGMAICPTSGTTLSAIAAGAAGNLIQRAAEVQLKEHRKLVLVPREAPISLTHIDNMRKATEAGAVVLPAAPGWYHGVETMADLVDFVVARICDQLGVRNALIKRWGEE